MLSLTNCTSNLIHVQLYKFEFCPHQFTTIYDDEQSFKVDLSVRIWVKNVRFFSMKKTICTWLWLCWRNSVNSSVNQIWNRMMFTLLRHSQWTEMTFQIDGWYVTGPDIVKWHGRWEKHAFIKLCIITTSPRIEHLAGVFVAACTARRQQFHQLIPCSYTLCFIKTREQLH